ncbi:MAG: DUF2384 domain-containing protein [Ichthyobacteriaceae bacterium]|nr:DUF2384 domain-containing protein [Ichthyobacteriaceae bacterium]
MVSASYELLSSLIVDSKEQKYFYEVIENKLYTNTIIENGLSIDVFAQIRLLTPYTDVEWSNYLDMSIKTLQRNLKDNSHVFKRLQSEKIIEVLEVFSIGMRVFGSADKFYKWLNINSYAFEGKKPTDLLITSYGKELILAELNRIEYGIFV